jgi:hypothetical protein
MWKALKQIKAANNAGEILKEYVVNYDIFHEQKGQIIEIPSRKNCDI